VTAEEFWRGAARNDGLRKGDPRHTYVRTVLVPSAVNGTAWRTASTAAVAWNAFFRKRELHVLRPNENRKIAILGTPYKG
jgi:hypothetical protein